MIDKYFRRPIFWDYLIATTIAVIITMIWRKNSFAIPKEDFLFSIVSDLSTVSLTMAGFILTLLTVLVSFKSTLKPRDGNIIESDSLYEIFFSTNLYFQTVKHLKNAVISLTFVAITGYSLKLTLNPKNYGLLFSYNAFSIVIIFFTLWRCLIILSKIIKIQQDN